MRGMRLLALLLLAVLLLMTANPVLAADGGPGGQVIFGEDFTLESGRTLLGDLVVFDGDVEVQEDSQISGDLVVWAGDADIDGTVMGSLSVLGGDLQLRENAVILGDLIVSGGSIEQEEGSVVQGQWITDADQLWWEGPVVVPPFVGRWPYAVHNEAGHIVVSILWAALRLVLTVFLMACLAGLVAVLWPQPAARVGRTVLRAPWSAFGLGLLTVVVVGALLISICLTVIGALAGIAVGVAAVFGWLCLGILIGQRLLTSESIHPFWPAFVGGGLLTLLSALLELIPCVGWIGGFLVACVGLGAVILTRFGSQEYPYGYPVPPPLPLRTRPAPPAAPEEPLEEEPPLEEAVPVEETPVEEEGRHRRRSKKLE